MFAAEGISPIANYELLDKFVICHRIGHEQALRIGLHDPFSFCKPLVSVLPSHPVFMKFALSLN